MHKLPVGETVIGAVKFGFQNMFTTIRLGWVGFLLSIIVIGIVGVLVFGGMDFSVFDDLDDWDYNSSEENMAALHAVFSIYGGIILAILIGSIAFVPLTVILTRMAAEVEDAPTGIGYFRLGGTEILYILGGIVSSILHSLVVFLALIPAFAAFGWGAVLSFSDGADFEAALDNSALGLGGAAVIVLLIVGIVLILWFALRMTTFLPAVAAEGGFPLFKALKMTGKNVWHLVGAWILFFLLRYAIEIGVSIGFVAVFLIFAFLFQAAGAEMELLGMLVIGAGGLIGAFLLLLYLMFIIASSVAFPARIYHHLKQNG
ncbi:hypothetical protein [Parvularcula sp. IMCC14364]|uniref:hypothetical protein n=1 Tax=Parvularcula sp. IMCC14364 TaxID=3067902 RepID=UPI0027415EC2|nr:hypothetical protein [Parvularcula sp. IMCC14364]